MKEREKLKAYLTEQYTKDWKRHQGEYISRVLELYDAFISAELEDRGFVSKITQNNEKFLQGLWEMRLAERLAHCGYNPKKQKKGPDFKIDINGTTCWVEAVSPTRGDGENAVPNHDDSGGNYVCENIHDSTLQRYTAAISDKKKKLDTYLKEGIVKDTEQYIIAINCELLELSTSSGLFTSYEHINEYPYAVCAVFPIGAGQIHIDEKTRNTLGRSYVYQPFIKNKADAPIPTDSFLNPANKHISAILGTYDSVIETIKGEENPSVLVHNPLAKTAVPIGIFDEDEDYRIALERVVNNSPIR